MDKATGKALLAAMAQEEAEHENRMRIGLSPTKSKHLGALTGGMPKILTIDIETAPHTVYSWGLWNQNHSISQIKEPGRVICFAAKWYDSKTVQFYSEFHEGRRLMAEDGLTGDAAAVAGALGMDYTGKGHDAMVKRAWELIDQADIVVGYNHKSFDLKHLNREFILAGLTPPSPVKTTDLLAVARQMFAFPSNKLDYVSQALGLGHKVKHSGQELWNDCLGPDGKEKEKAWSLMKKYNIGDVRLTEALLDYLGPWIKSTQMPHLGLWTGERCCYRCGATDLKHVGWYHTTVSAYARMQCGSCGAWNRLTHIKNRTETRPI